MKTIITLLAIFMGLLLIQSCSTDDSETPVRQDTMQFKPGDVPVESVLIHADTLSHGDESDIDPPTSPPVKP